MKNMMLSLVGIVGLGMVAAQSSSPTSSSSSAAASSTALPVSTAMIPSNISTTCSAFLNTLNTDTQFASCISPLVNLTTLYAPSSNSTSSLTTSDITTTLTNLCHTSSICPTDLIRSYLSQFQTQCSGELQGSDYNDQVREMYDYLYVVNPFVGAVCARDTASAKYCVLEIASASLTSSTNGTSASSNSTSAGTNSTGNTLTLSNKFTATASSLFAPVADAAANLVIYNFGSTSSLPKRLLQSLSPRQSASIQAAYVTPNTTTYRSTSLPYLFLQPNMSSALLCTSCTQQVLAAYASWESQMPYALGLSSSPILGAQATLWKGVESTCGGNFTDAISKQAGVLAANGSVGISSGAIRAVGLGGEAFMGVVIGVVGVVAGLMAL